MTLETKKEKMTLEIYMHIFSFLDLCEFLIASKVNKLFRFAIINDNNRWYSMCFNEIYDNVLYLSCRKEKRDYCLYCLTHNVLRYEEIIDYNIERNSELFSSYYMLYIKTMEKLLVDKKKGKNECKCEEKYELSKICKSSECICTQRLKNMLLNMFPQLENMSKYNYDSIIKYTLSCIDIRNEIVVCEMCYDHFEENEILWIDECILYKCHLMAGDEGNCTCGLMSICKECRMNL